LLRHRNDELRRAYALKYGNEPVWSNFTYQVGVHSPLLKKTGDSTNAHLAL
jgi:hypothetical protein